MDPVRCIARFHPDQTFSPWMDFCNALDLFILFTNQEGEIQYVNHPMAKHFGQNDSPIGKPFKDFFTPVPSNPPKNSWNLFYHNGTNYFIKKIKTLPNEKMNMYLIIPKTELFDILSNLDIYQAHREELQAILDCIHDGIYITDGSGTTMLVNKEAEKTGGLSAEELVGRNMADLVREGYCSESVSLKVIEQGKPVSIIQNLGDGNQLIVSGTPYYKDGEIKMVITTERDISEITKLRRELEQQYELTEKYQSELEYFRSQSAVVDEMVIESQSMKNLIDMALRIAKLDATVLIQGESGTGKEIISKIIYKNSARSKGPIIKINCSAIPENLLESELFGYEKGAFTSAHSEGKIGLFELANHGTLFLDEIGELPLPLQAKLLRAIQEKEIMRIGGKKSIPIDVRIIAATNVNLQEAVKEGKFRADLFYRLNVVPLTIPPLRNRKEDIPGLVKHFIAKFNQKYKTNKELDKDAWPVLIEYDWPGNVRELENLIERIIVTQPGSFITKKQILNQLYHGQSDRPLSDLNQEKPSELSLREQVEQFEKNLLLQMMPHYKNTRELAKALQVDKSTINRKLNKYRIRNIYAD